MRVAILITLAALAGNAGAERLVRLGVPFCQLWRAYLDTCPVDEMESRVCRRAKEVLSNCSAEEQKLPPDPRVHFPTQSLGEFGDLGWYKDLGYDMPSQEEHKQCLPELQGGMQAAIDLITLWPPDFSVMTPEFLAVRLNAVLKKHGVSKEKRQRVLWAYAWSWSAGRDEIPTEEDVRERKHEWLKMMMTISDQASEALEKQ